MILPGHEDPRNCVDPRNLAKSEWDQKLGNTECVFSLYEKMGWKYDVVYLTLGLPNIYSVSLIPPPLPVYLHTLTVTPQRCTCRPWLNQFQDGFRVPDRVNLYLHSQPVSKRVCGDNWGPTLSELKDALGGGDRVSLGIHWEAWIEQVCRAIWKPTMSQLRDALGGHDRASLDMHLKAEIEWTQRCTWPLWSIEFGDALGDYDRVSFDMHLEGEFERTMGCTWSPW